MFSVKGLGVGISVAVLAITGIRAAWTALDSASATAGAEIGVGHLRPRLHNGELVNVTRHRLQGRGRLGYTSLKCLASAKGAAQCNTLGAIPRAINTKGQLPRTHHIVYRPRLVMQVRHEEIKPDDMCHQCGQYHWGRLRGGSNHV